MIGIAGVGLKEHTPLNDILESYIHNINIDLQNNFLHWDCTPEALKAYSEAIKLESKLPFPYVYRAACEKENSTGDWQHDLDTARRILVITTQIPGHHKHHDDFMKAIDTGNWVEGVR